MHKYTLNFLSIQSINNMEKNLQDLCTRLNDAYNAAALSGAVINRKEFAAMVGVASTTLSAAMNGNPKMLTETIVLRAEKAVRVFNKIEPLEPFEPLQTIKAPDAPASEDIKGEDMLSVMRDMCACVNNMCETLNKERESHERIITSMLEAFKR